MRERKVGELRVNEACGSGGREGNKGSVEYCGEGY